MNYYDFKGKMIELCYKNNQKIPTVNELIYFFEQYDHTYNLVNSEKKAKAMKHFSLFGHEKRLKYRMQLAQSGIELTPCQVNYYINMICIIIKDKYNIDT